MQPTERSSLIPPNPFDPRIRADPYPLYQYMRTVEPIHRSEVGYWILTRYEDCRTVLEDARWGHDADLILEPLRGDFDPVDPTVRLLRSSLLFSDPPRHALHRRPLESAMRKSMPILAERTGKVAEGLVTLLREKSSADLIRDYAAPLPLVLISDLLGLPVADRPELQRWAGQLAGGLDPAVRAANVVNAGAAAAAFTQYMLERVEAARKTPTAGLVGDLAAAPGRMTTWELIADLTVFLVIGIETTAALIGNCILALLRNPAQLTRLRAEPALAGTALEELIRFDGPTHLTARVATEDLLLNGVRIASGEQAIVLLGAANRDPDQFPEPDRIDLGRSGNPHLGFGQGLHACIAAPLARTIGAVALTALLEGFPRIELEGDPAWSANVTVRGLSRLNVNLRP